MKRIPRLIGRVLLTEGQGRALAEGATVNLPRMQFRALCRAPAHIGDFLWVQEPYHEYLPKNQWNAQSVHGIVPGPRLGTPIPAHIARAAHTSKYRDGSRLPRCLSRCTLEIVGMMDEDAGIVCVAHMVQVNEFMQARIAA
jgi:hypothetical protein